jgi:hypothetical protein
MTQLQGLSSIGGSVELWQGMPEALRQLQQLQSLHLSWFGSQDTFAMMSADYPAMTSSSQLTNLIVTSCHLHIVAARHLFRHGLLLPYLQHFKCQAAEYVVDLQPGDLQHSLQQLHPWSLKIHNGDLKLIADSCPALQSLGTLDVSDGLPNVHTQLLPLLQLSALTNLSIGGAGCTDDVAERVLSRMTGGGSSGKAHMPHC